MAENLGYDLSAFEVSRINSEVLASFLEESLMEDNADDERLTSVMRSLEAEISGAAAGGRDDVTSLPEMKFEDDHHGSTGGLQAYDLSASEGYSTSEDLEFDWTSDAEMACCSPSDDEMNSMLLEYSADEIEDAVMFVGIENHTQTQFWDGVFLEEHGYGSLWQQPYNSL